MIALHHYPAVMGEAGADGDRGLGIEAVVRVELRNVWVGGAEGGDLHVAVHAESVAHAERPIRRDGEQAVFCCCGSGCSLSCSLIVTHLARSLRLNSERNRTQFSVYPLFTVRHSSHLTLVCQSASFGPQVALVKATSCLLTLPIAYFKCRSVLSRGQ